MSERPDGIEALSIDECWALLDRNTVGRLAVDNGGQPDIFPINYVVESRTGDRAIVFRSGPGTKLAAAVLMHHVAFEIDGYEPHGRTAWSVVLRGRAHEIEGMEEVFAAEDLPLFPWAAHPKPVFVRITPNEVTGRRFHVVDTVVPDASVGWEADDDFDHDPDLAAHDGEFHAGAPKLHPD
jgi:nitroimidazol reductase NimA-like FMN-containing flavoprotein (pyridoxamine 5'-phosphate oxidase superfamily)